MYKLEIDPQVTKTTSSQPSQCPKKEGFTQRNIKVSNIRDHLEQSQNIMHILKGKLEKGQN